ncbi:MULTISPECIES: alpha/beta hydrolase [unclassified Microbacterium]|uniref:alpha/beta hydrolase n=1 Tax=unclassified Microbacterium TaxID=2609290 RepID=UPI00301775F4
MPLDPFFAERLRVHRRYLFDQSRRRVRARVVEAWSRVTRLRGAERTASPASPAAAGPRADGGGAVPSARARHRRAALAWDRSELAAVGVPGPALPTAEYQVPVPGHPDVRVRVYRPVASSDTPLAAVVTFFGGAFRIGGIDYPSTDAACRRRAVALGAVVVAVDYALAPEHRYPTQVEQGIAAIDWLFDTADSLGVDRSRIAVSGVSSGACIAAAVCLANRDGARHPLVFQVLEVPVVDLTGAHIDVRATWALGIPSIFVVRELRSIARTYLRSSAQARDSLASPLRASSHSDLPPALILTAEYDPLRPQGDAYGAALRAAGVEAAVVQYRGVTHDVPLFGGALLSARLWEQQVVGALRSRLGRGADGVERAESEDAAPGAADRS